MASVDDQVLNFVAALRRNVFVGCEIWSKMGSMVITSETVKHYITYFRFCIIVTFFSYLICNVLTLFFLQISANFEVNSCRNGTNTRRFIAIIQSIVRYLRRRCIMKMADFKTLT